MELVVTVSVPSVHEKQTCSLYKASSLILKMAPVIPLSSSRKKLVEMRGTVQAEPASIEQLVIGLVDVTKSVYV